MQNDPNILPSNGEEWSRQAYSSMMGKIFNEESILRDEQAAAMTPSERRQKEILHNESMNAVPREELEAKLATVRADVKAGGAEMRADFAALRADFADLRSGISELRADMHQESASQIKWFAVTLLGGLSAVVAIMSVLVNNAVRGVAAPTPTNQPPAIIINVPAVAAPAAPASK